MSTLRDRWENEAIYMEMLQRTFSPPVEPRETSWAWWRKAPKTANYAYDTELFDFRELTFDSKNVGKISLAGLCLDDLQGRIALYKETGFQSSTAQRADFSGSEFDYAQMSPFYARGASFKDCKMAHCYLMGIGPRLDPRNPSEPIKGNFSDFRDCDFSNVVATHCHFDRCDFRGARFTNARFVDCQFDAADLTEVNLEGASFEGCDFSYAELTDTEKMHALVNRGNNIAVEKINWR